MQSKWKKNKKAVELPPNVLITILIVLIGFFFVIILVRNLMAGAEEGTMDLVCKASVAARARSVIQIGPDCILGVSQKACLVPNPFNRINTIPLLCQTKEKEISGSKFVIMDSLAKYMEACWSMFGEGKFPYVIEDATKSSTCFPCYILLIKKIGKGKEVITGDQLLQHLKEREITYLNITEKYIDYLTDHGGIPGALVFPNEITEKAYYIMYSDPYFEKDGTPNGIYVVPVDEMNSKDILATSITFFEAKGRAKYKTETCKIYPGI